ncbi:Major facilitator superfamily domain, general substrate transporter [Penicillium occitanis (nom. inval.)]|nr:Major facilitator superfamily domain, general substrate transporter [Penicillium occitanis (nom. inval.)]PCG93531.1 hypothetical protein PENOC_087220 [Penicillium occitanis (nom. inval.)]
MPSILASSAFGHIVRLTTGNRYLLYPEEEPSFELPERYQKVTYDRQDTGSSTDLDLPTYVNEQRSEAHSSPTACCEIIISWYDEADPENPRNWSMAWRILVNVQVGLYTIAVYMSSSIYTASEVYVSRIYGVSSTVASLGLALYILGYGFGPMFFSPLSEIPSVGRNPPYIATMLIFIVLSVPTALVDNVPGLMVLRFLQGFFGSPCLATGGASITDVSNPLEAPYFMYSWALFALGAPAIGPIISGFSVPAETWRWSLWEILWFAAPVFVIMVSGMF